MRNMKGILVKFRDFFLCKCYIISEDLKQKDLIPIIGDSAVVSKVLKGQRKLTVEMIKNLHKQLKIPFESLFGKMVISNR